MNYAEISKETISYLYKSYGSLKTSTLNPSLRALVELHVSKINGCAYCCSVHLEEAKKLNVSQEKLDSLEVWSTSAQIFTNEERAALQWAEVITYVKKDHDKARELLFRYYTEKEIVDLTVCVSLMNAFNRIAIALRD